MSGGGNMRFTTSRAGQRGEQAASGKVEFATAGGHKLTLDGAAGGSVTLQHSNGYKITIDGSGKVEIWAAQLSTTAPMVSVDAGIAQFIGLVKCDTLVANAVLNTTYSPGAGNVW